MNTNTDRIGNIEKTNLFSSEKSMCDKFDDEETDSPRISNRDIKSDNETEPSESKGDSSELDIPDSEHTFTTLMHRYDAEISRMNSLKKEAVFRITVIGFLVTIGIGLLGINGIDLKALLPLKTPLTDVCLLLFLICLVCMICCLISSVAVIIHIEKNKDYRKGINSNRYFWTFPDDNYLDTICSNTPILPTQNQDTKKLAEIIKYNSNNNNITRTKGNRALVLLISAVISVIILIIILLLIIIIVGGDNILNYHVLNMIIVL